MLAPSAFTHKTTVWLLTSQILKAQKEEKGNSILPELNTDRFGGAISQYSWLFVSAVFTFEESTNSRLKIFWGKNPRKFQKGKPEFATYQARC